MPWLRHHLGRGIVHSYVIGFQLEQRWWTLFFERAVSVAEDGSEHWWIEAYAHNGKTWSGNYSYSPTRREWRLGDSPGYGIRSRS